MATHCRSLSTHTRAGLEATARYSVRAVPPRANTGRPRGRRTADSGPSCRDRPPLRAGLSPNVASLVCLPCGNLTNDLNWYQSQSHTDSFLMALGADTRLVSAQRTPGRAPHALPAPRPHGASSSRPPPPHPHPWLRLEEAPA